MTQCSTCNGFRVLMGPDGRTLYPCACQPDTDRWKAARIPERYFDEPLVPMTTPESWLLWGPVGTGKTRRAVGMLKSWARKRSGGLFVDLWELSEDRKAAVGSEDTDLPGDEYPGAAFLVCDDLARNPRMTPFWEDYLSTLVRRRYNANLPTIFTSNHPPDELERRIGDHLVSRIVQGCGPRIVEMSGRDRRIA